MLGTTTLLLYLLNTVHAVYTIVDTCSMNIDGALQTSETRGFVALDSTPLPFAVPDLAPCAVTPRRTHRAATEDCSHAKK